jgi:hypothetical protein
MRLNALCSPLERHSESHHRRPACTLFEGQPSHTNSLLDIQYVDRLEIVVG